MSNNNSGPMIAIKISGVFLGVLLMGTISTMQLARAGPDTPTINHHRCDRVATSDLLRQTHSSQYLHPEPGEDLLMNEEVNIITGLYTRSYSRGQNGVIDYKTARQIIISEYNEYWNTVVETKEFPLFYWEDVNHDGTFEMWVDQQGDGSPCDIVPYQIYDKAEQTQPIGYK